MSTKCSLLYSKNFHLYFDYKDMDIHYEENNKEKKISKEFLEQVHNLCKYREALITEEFFRKKIMKDFYKDKNDKVSN